MKLNVLLNMYMYIISCSEGKPRNGVIIFYILCLSIISRPSQLFTIFNYILFSKLLKIKFKISFYASQIL